MKVWILQGNQLKTLSRRRLAIRRTKQTEGKTIRGRPTRGVKKEPQEDIIEQVSFADKMSTRTQDSKTFRRTEDVMIKSHDLFYPPT